MKRAWPVTQAAVSLAAWPLTVILSPVILVAGEPVNRYVRRLMRRTTADGQPVVIQYADRPARPVAVLPRRASLLLAVISNPLWIALTAPGPLGERPVPQATGAGVVMEYRLVR